MLLLWIPLRQRMGWGTLMNAVDTILSKQIAVAQMLATSPALQNDDIAAFRNTVANMMPGTKVEIGFPENHEGAGLIDAIGSQSVLNGLHHMMELPGIVRKIFWAEQNGPKQGRIVSQGVEQSVQNGVGVIRARNAWVGPDGKVHATDDTTIRFRGAPEGRYLDYEVTLKDRNDMAAAQAFIDGEVAKIGRGIDHRLDHVEEHTVSMVLDAGYWAGMTLYPHSKCSLDRAIDILETHGTDRLWMNSACDWGVSDPLSVPKCALQMRVRQHGAEMIERVIYQNPRAFLSQSPRFSTPTSREW